jgi:hypothetical protein
MTTKSSDEEQKKIIGVWQWNPLRQEPEAPSNNATSRGLRRITPAGAGGLQVAGFNFTGD